MWLFIWMSGGFCKKKSPGKEPGDSWVDEGARTPDPQNHNLVL